MLLWIALAPLVACTGGPATGDAWSQAFDVGGETALSGVSGSGPSDVYMVGGDESTGSIWHYDGSTWALDESAPSTDLLVWVHAFSDEEVWIVGEGGAVLRGSVGAWEPLSVGTTEPLWGVWGRSASDLWIVGGDVLEGTPLVYHWDGSTFTPEVIDDAQNDRDAKSLFKVWGIDGRVLAVGQRGLIVEHTEAGWVQRLAGPEANDDFVSLWGTSADEIVIVGGRAGARIAMPSGSDFSTRSPDVVPGLNAVSFTPDGLALIGGANGWVGTYDPADPEAATLAENVVDGTSDVHAIWHDGADTAWGVAGHFTEPYFGAALVRHDP